MVRLVHWYKAFDSEIRAKNWRELKYWVRGKYWDWREFRTPSPIFVVGCSRAGTTVTYETLAASDELASFGFELPQLWHSLWGPKHNNFESEAAGAEHARPEHREYVLRYFYQRLGTGRILEKSCINVMRIPYLCRLFPDAHFVYIQRDGRDNVSSLIDGWRLQDHFALDRYLGTLPDPVHINGGEFRTWRFFLPPGWRKLNNASLEEVCAYQWIKANEFALAGAANIPENQWHRVRYEEFFENPAEVFANLYDGLGLQFTSKARGRCNTLYNYQTSIISSPPKREKWRYRNRASVERILGHIGPMQKRLGYD